MAIKLHSTRVTVPLIWSGDPSVDADASDLAKYVRDPASVSACVVHDGEATIFHCRPISSVERVRVLDRVAVEGFTSDQARLQYQCVEALAVALERVEGLNVEGLEGKGGRAVVDALPLNIAYELGLAVLTMSTATSHSATADSAFDRLFALREDVGALLEALPDDVVPPEAHDAYERVRERLKLSAAESLDPAEEEGEDLPL